MASTTRWIGEYPAPDLPLTLCPECQGTPPHRDDYGKVFAKKGRGGKQDCPLCDGVGYTDLDPTKPIPKGVPGPMRVSWRVARYAAGLPLWMDEDSNELDDLCASGVEFEGDGDDEFDDDWGD